MLLGMGGAVLGGWVGGLLGRDVDETLIRWLSAVGGALLLLVLYHLATAPRPRAGGTVTSEDDQRAVFDELARGPPAGAPAPGHRVRWRGQLHALRWGAVDLLLPDNGSV